MIGSILTAAIPVVATIAAALYVLRKIQQYGNMASQRVHDSSMAMEEPGSSVRSGNLKGIALCVSIYVCVHASFCEMFFIVSHCYSLLLFENILQK